MSADDALGTVTICQRGRAVLYADDAGVTVRHSRSRIERFAWADVSGFAEKSSHSDNAGSSWYLVVVLRTGRKVEFRCTPASETLTAIRQVADRYGILADVTGVLLLPGLYQDPAGQNGLRYWDGRYWSPLLPPDFSRPRSVRKSPATWPTLPAAEGRWTYAASEAKVATVWLALAAPTAVVLLIIGLVVELYWDLGKHHRQGDLGLFIAAGVAAVFAIPWWGMRRFYVKLDKAANSSVGVRD